MIIIPQRCITMQDRVYCERTELSPVALGTMILLIVLFVAWLLLWMHLHVERNWNGFVVFAGFFAPFILIGLYLIS